MTEKRPFPVDKQGTVFVRYLCVMAQRNQPRFFFFGFGSEARAATISAISPTFFHAGYLTHLELHVEFRFHCLNEVDVFQTVPRLDVVGGGGFGDGDAVVIKHVPKDLVEFFHNFFVCHFSVVSSLFDLNDMVAFFIGGNRQHPCAVTVFELFGFGETKGAE